MFLITPHPTQENSRSSQRPYLFKFSYTVKTSTCEVRHDSQVTAHKRPYSSYS